MRDDHIEVSEGVTIPPAKTGHYLVAIYLENGKNHDYHFVRQDADGGWSDKAGNGVSVARYKAPAEDGSVVTPDLTYGPYQLIGYAYAPKEGINLGLSTFVEKTLQQDRRGHSLRFLFDRSDSQISKQSGGYGLTTNIIHEIHETLAQHDVAHGTHNAETFGIICNRYYTAPKGKENPCRE